ncbi:Pyruvate kinase [Magnetospirillum gryphiswaldense MSR-1 v2]|uniref:Pyruvate kinase n=1 Tax=Magnetospirillum gryphiswaldense (strain DSM 6361 / JCM 21280 / NBRC 15271 / MSR-1) TaxID=431944 RepID=V6F176_MAGGM|nr:pyruvate kinase [Magnetospirillum gryphiswaldense]CDK99255.1 Pyruvate kinase [Magnetospirillum gryphiswaldense MSR-1 v2]
MRRTRKAKIIATLGPASSTPQAIESLFRAGADVFRLNFSHGSHADHQARYDTIRALEQKIGRPIGVLADLQGPKLRVGKFADGKIKLETGATFRLDLSPELGTSVRAPLLHPEVFAAMNVGTELLLDDGKLRLRVEQHGGDFAETRVIVGGELSNHKGVNVPNVVLPISPLTDKDKADLDFAVDMGADWIALSFVQRPGDVLEARKLIARKVGSRVRLLSKLEKPSAIDYLEEIVELSDAVMVARGDLGVECPPESVPILQKRIIKCCRSAGKPVVVATQMLDSMVHSPSPTRAEASDVATAIYDGADAVMLSAETASGDYPVDAVTMMDRIINRVEEDDQYTVITDASRSQPENTTRDAISAAARQVAHTLKAAAVVTFTSSGSTTLRAARERPQQPIISLTSGIEVARQLALVWGAHCVPTQEVRSFAEMVQTAAKAAQDESFAHPGDRIVITAGVPFGCSGTTNILRVAEIEESGEVL